MKLIFKLKYRENASLQIHNNFYFDPKIYFIHFSIIKLKRKERKLSKNGKKKKRENGCLLLY
jgi:hypothetical protein